MLYNIQNEWQIQPAVNFMKRILKEKGHVIVEVDEHKLKRSIKQNNYYRGVIVPMAAQEYGCTRPQIHEVFKKEILGYTEIRSHGRVEKVLISTTSLNTAEFEQFTEHCRIIANEWLGLNIPLPNETVDYYKKKKDDD